MKNKVCSKCHIRLSLDNFIKDSTKRDGLYPSCKTCYRERVGGQKRPDWFGKKIILNDVRSRWCEGCKNWLDCDLFYTRKNGYPNTRCKSCVLKQRTSEKYRISDKIRRDKERFKVISYYSNGELRCGCCGEKEYKFLCIDHINGNGNKHRKSIGGGNHLYRYLIKNNYPDGMRVLCHNCNMARGFYGECPHNEKNISKK